MAIQDELSEEAKHVILTSVKKALKMHFVDCTQEVVEELRVAGYGVPSPIPGRGYLSEECIGEILHILGTDFFN